MKLAIVNVGRTLLINQDTYE
jgi:hypothetical protein